jgi:ribosomal RNA-processing protein 9
MNRLDLRTRTEDDEAITRAHAASMSRALPRDSFFVKPKTSKPTNTNNNNSNNNSSQQKPSGNAKKRPSAGGASDVAGKAARRGGKNPRARNNSFRAEKKPTEFLGADDEIGSGDDEEKVGGGDDDVGVKTSRKDTAVSLHRRPRSHDDASTSENADEKRSRLAQRYIANISHSIKRSKAGRHDNDDGDKSGGAGDSSSGDNVVGRVVAGQKDDEVDAMVAASRRRRRLDGDDAGDDVGGGSFEIETAVEAADEDHESRVRRLIDQQITDDQLEQDSKLVHAVARHTRILDSGSLWLKGLKAPVTCVAATDDFVFAGCKQGSIMQWCAKTGRRLHTYRGAVRAPVESGGHVGAVLCLAVSTDGKLLLSGGADCIARLWDVAEKQLVDSFSGHREPVTGVAFRRHTHQFYTTSVDRTVRVYDGDERLYMDTLFGHQAPVQALAAFSKERCVTVSSDRTLRVWKVLQESQLVFRGHKASIDCLAMLDDAWFVTGSQDGAVSFWNAARKRPHASVSRAHPTAPDAAESGNGGWVSACAALPLTDLVATGSCDGFVRLWRADRQSKRFGPASYVYSSDRADNSDEEANGDAAEAPSSRYQTAMAESAVSAPGFVNGLCFAPDGSFVVAALSREHRLGRWSTIKQARDGVLLTRLQLPVQLRAREQSLFDGDSNNVRDRDSDESDDASGDEREERDGDD